MRIIVTGAAGFIGTNTVLELNRRAVDDLLLVDRLGNDEKWRNLLGLQYDDLVDPDELLRRLECNSLDRPDAVIHLGACSATTEKDADYLLRNNYQYTRQLCQWCLARQVRFVYASSAATYGDGSAGYSDDLGLLQSLRPLNMYGYSKHMFDLWAMKHDLFRVIVGLKYFNVYGPHEAHKGDMRSVVHKSFGQIQQASRVKLFKSYNADYADGEQMRDFIYVKDAVDMTLWFVEHDDVGGLFNCGTGQARTWKDLVNAVFSAMGKESRIDYIEMPEQLRGKYQYFTEADMRKLREAGYEAPFTSLEDGVRDYVQNHLMEKAPAAAKDEEPDREPNE